MALQSVIDGAGGVGGLPWDTVIKNLAAQAPDVLGLLEAVAYVIGIFFLIAAIVLASKAGNPAVRQDGTSKHAWVWSLAISCLMMALPSTIVGAALTLFGAPVAAVHPLAYMGVEGSHKLGPLIPLLKIFGVIAVMRGLMIFRRVGMYAGNAGGNTTFNRGLVLMISGIGLIYMMQVLSLASGITGLNFGMDLF